MAQRMEDFPNEILLHIFSSLPLKSLITSRTVSQEWRRLIPLADISPIRRAFLDFYLTLIDSPIFRQTRLWVLANLKPFDRQQYIDNLISNHPYVPKSFRVWILEWPAKAVVGCVWPGLPTFECFWQGGDIVYRIEGANGLEPLHPMIRALPFQHVTPDSPRALCIFHSLRALTFLLLDERERFCDKVFTLTKNLEDHWEWGVIDDNWIEWQKRTWGKIETAAKKRAERDMAILQLEDMSPSKEEGGYFEQE